MKKEPTSQPARTLLPDNGFNEVATGIVKRRKPRHLFKAVGATRTPKRLRVALKSAEGAEWHAQCRHSRAQVVV